MAPHGSDHDDILPFDLEDDPTVQAQAAARAREWEDDEDITNVSAAPRSAPGVTLDASAINPGPGTLTAYLMQVLYEGDELAHMIAPHVVLVRIGRGRENEIQVASDGEISRRHCAILRQGDEFFVEDLRSTNGTLINGEPVAVARLAGNDELKLGESLFRFVCVAPSAAARGRTILAG
ncbi:MAG: FHA domain-containing protein [Pseudomonadota bacterium]